MDMYLFAFFVFFIMVGWVEGAKKVLVLGGNGFMGAATVKLLLEQNFEITITSRGSYYWQSSPDARVRHVVCDRYSSATLTHSCPALHRILLQERFDFILDFSCYHQHAMTKILDQLQDFYGIYVYISSDSVYEVCERTHNDLAVETDAPCPDDDQKFTTLLRRADDYGYGKLEAETVLTSAKFDYVILRLPDVIGPRDSLHRLWRYLIWMQVSDRLNKPVPLPSFYLNRPMSLVYVDDVANVISKIMTSSNDVTILNHAYNIAFDEQISLYRLLEMARGFQVRNRENDYVKFQVDHTSGFYLYPSVNLGPVNISKARNMLNFQPTALADAVKNTVDFFEEVMQSWDKNLVYKWNKERVIARLVQGPFQGLEKQLQEEIENIYGRHKDEL